MSEVINPYWNRRRTRNSVYAGTRIGTANIRLSTAIYAVVTAVLLAACFTYHRQTRSELDIAMAKRQVEAARVDKLTVEAERLRSEIQSIKTDPRMIEFVARHDLGFVRPGDVVIKIIPPGEGDRSAGSSNAASEISSSHPQ